MKPFKIRYDKIQQDLAGTAIHFPKYTTQLLNLANQNAQGTRPKVAGQMSDLIQEFPGKTYEEWVTWYMQKNQWNMGNRSGNDRDLCWNAFSGEHTKAAVGAPK